MLFVDLWHKKIGTNFHCAEEQHIRNCSRTGQQMIPHQRPLERGASCLLTSTVSVYIIDTLPRIPI